MIHRIKLCQSCGWQNAPVVEPDDGICAACSNDEYRRVLKKYHDNGEPYLNDVETSFVKELLNKLMIWASHNGVTL